MVLSNTQSLFWIWASKLLLWRRFDFAFLGQKKKTEMGMVDFSFSSQKVWNLNVSISSRIMRFVFKISLSLLEIGENCRFLDFFCKNSRSLLEPENRSRHFSFLFSKFEIWIPYFSFSSRFHFLASRQCLLCQHSPSRKTNKERVKALTRCQKVKSRKEREIWNPYLKFREEKCRDLFSGSRREQEFLQKIIEKSAIFSNFEKRKRNFEIKSHDARGDWDVEISNFLWREREIHHSHFWFFLLS